MKISLNVSFFFVSNLVSQRASLNDLYVLTLLSFHDKKITIRRLSQRVFLVFLNIYRTQIMDKIEESEVHSSRKRHIFAVLVTV